jgi:hypothetical protein
MQHSKKKSVMQYEGVVSQAWRERVEELEEALKASEQAREKVYK